MGYLVHALSSSDSGTLEDVFSVALLQHGGGLPNPQWIPHLSRNKSSCVKPLRFGGVSDTAAEVLYLTNTPHDMAHWIGELFSWIVFYQLGLVTCCISYLSMALIGSHGDWMTFKKWETISYFLIIVIFGKIKKKSMKAWSIGKTV